MKAKHSILLAVFFGAFLVAAPRQARADIVSDSRAAAGVISNYLQGVSAVFGNDILQKPIQDMIALTQDALEQQPPEALQFIAEGTQFASILTDFLSLQGEIEAASQPGGATHAGALLRAGQDLWDLFWIIASKTGLQSGDILPGGGMLTAFGAANYVIGYQFFVVGQVLNLELSVVNYGVGIINAGMDAKDHAMAILGGQTFFCDTEKAMFNDYLVGVDQGIYWPLIDMLRTDMGINSYVPKTSYNTFDVTANYPGFPFADPKVWTIAADGKVITSNGQKKLQIALWTYTKEAGGKLLPQIRMEYLQDGVWTNVSFATNFWNSPDGNAQNNVLYGPKCTFTAEFPLPPNSRLPSEVRTVWSFLNAPDTTNLTVFRFADIQIQSPNRSGNFLTANSAVNGHVSIPITISSVLAVTNLTWSLTPLNTTNNPPIVATNVQAQFIEFPAGLTNGQSVTASLDLDFPVNVSTGAYTGILQIDALNSSPITLAVQVAVAAVLTPPIIDLTNGLVAYYPFNGNANDESGNGNDATFIGTNYYFTADPACTISNGTFIDAGNIFPSNPDTLTESGWIKSTQQQQPIGNGYLKHIVFMTKRTGTNATPTWLFGGWPTLNINNQGFLALTVDDDSYGNYCQNQSYTASSVFDGQWHHIVGVKSNSIYSLYFDGKPIATITDSHVLSASDGTEHFWIGRHAWYSTSPQDCEDLSASLRDVRIYNRALSSNEVQQLYVTEGGLNAGLVAYYPFNGNADDQSGRGHTGTTHGNLTFVPGIQGQSAWFDGGSAYVSVPESSDLDLIPPFTISAWFNFEEGGTCGPRILHKQSYDLATQGLGISRPVGFGVYRPGSWWYTAYSPPISANSWTHVVGTHDGSYVRLYVNGILVDEGLDTNPMPINGYDLNIGRNTSTGCDYFKGCIDEVRFYNRAFSASEVMQLYALDWRPTLGALSQGGNLVFSWPTNIPAFTLESATNLGPSAIWTPVSPAPVVVNGQFFITNSLSEPSMFYRLKK